MKKLINKCSSYAFWVGLASAIVVLVESIGRVFGFAVDSYAIEELIMSICGVLVVLGIVTKDKSNGEKSTDDTESNVE